MAAMSIQNVQQALAEWMDQRVMTALDSSSPIRWIIGGASTVGLARLDSVIKVYSPLLKSIGILDETGHLILDVFETFVRSAFEKQSIVRMPILGVPFAFNEEDGTALIACLKKYGGING